MIEDRPLNKQVLDLSRYDLSGYSIHPENWLMFAEEMNIEVLLTNDGEGNEDLDEYFVLDNDGKLLGVYRQPGENDESYRRRLTQFIKFVNDGADPDRWNLFCRWPYQGPWRA